MNADAVCVNGPLRYECHNFSFINTSAMYYTLFVNGNNEFEFETWG